MGWRTVIVTDRAKLEYAMGYMVVRGQETKRVFLDDVQTVILETPAVAMTGVWLNECARRKIKVIFCNEKHNPASELVSYIGSGESSGRIRVQIRWEEERKAQVWQVIIREKIRQQRLVLEEWGHPAEAAMLAEYEKDVLPGDVTNREGPAAKVYFNALRGKSFTRRDPCALNGALDYGYAVLLAFFNREIVAAGYLTQLGLKHDNQYNPFNLGSDLMEPFRPLIDCVAMVLCTEEFTEIHKRKLVDVLNRTVRQDGKKVLVSQAIGTYVHSVFRAMEEGHPEEIMFYERADEW